MEEYVFIILPMFFVVFGAFAGVFVAYIGIRDLIRAAESEQRPVVWIGPLVQAKSYRLQ
jgi:hypothetical protein